MAKNSLSGLHQFVTGFEQELFLVGIDVHKLVIILPCVALTAGASAWSSPHHLRQSLILLTA